MKQTKIILLVIFLSLGYISSAQIKQTTEAEYKIGSIGYRMLLTMKVDLKGGYSVSDLATYEYGERKAEFKGLFRVGETSPCAVILVYQKVRSAPEYYCIPTPDAPEALWDQFRATLNGETDNKQEQLHFFCFALAKAMMFFSGK